MINDRVFASLGVLIGVCVIIIRSWEQAAQNVPEDGRLNYTALANKYGHAVEEHDVVTEDGYILKLFHIPGDVERPVLLVHGIIDSADTFIIRGNGSLAITLANKGYDVWAGNTRGGRYSRRHVSLDPDRSDKFWDFSFHELGYYDLPALIDFVLSRTGQTSLSAVGHSQGNTIFYVLGSTKPEYNSKVKVLVALSPVCFLNHPKPPVATLIALVPFISKVLQYFGRNEFLGDNTIERRLLEAVCVNKKIGYTLCARGAFFVIGGEDEEEVEPEFFPVVAKHYPTGSSRKNALHLAQISNSKSFSQYDYGAARNLELYKSDTPAKYDLGKVAMRVAMFAGGNDGISSLKDVRLLRKNLPNVVDYRVVEHKKFSHLDAVWGRNMDRYLFPGVFKVLETYV